MRLFVGNLPFATREDALRSFCEQHGLRVKNVKIATERDTGRSRGYGFVELESGTVDAAIAALNGKQLEGRTISVDAAKEQGDRR